MNKLLSIIIPAYNMEQYLRHALESCIVQDEELKKTYEVIVVNDGSKDTTSIIAEEYARKYRNIFRVINKENGGYGSALNVGIETACGKYYKVLDADDWYDTNGLQEFLRSLENTDCDMIMTDFTTVNEKNGKIERHSYSLKENVVFGFENKAALSHPLVMHALCWRTAILKDNHIKITEQCFYTDTEYVLYPLPYIETVIYYPISLYQYRIGREGQSMSLEGMAKHAGDLERVIRNINTYFGAGINKNNTLIKWKIADVYMGYINFLWLLPCSKQNKAKLKLMLEECRDRYPDGFHYYENKKIKLLRKSNYMLYRPCCMWRRLEWARGNR